MTHLLDTDHVSFWQRQQSPEYAAIFANLAHHEDSDIGVSVVSLHEQAMGCNNLINNPEIEKVLRGFEFLHRIIAAFRSFNIVQFDKAAQLEFEGLKKRKIRIGTDDLRIAAIARVHNLTVVTRNRRDFSQVPGLKIEDWTK